MVKVSVIVPAYNIERYVKECIKSIQNQTLKDIEIIIVNDGSKDKTKAIIEKLGENDSRIKIINKKNEGLLAARGTGIKNSSGKYIINIDGDDWIEEDCVEKMYDTLEKTNADMVMCDFTECYLHKKLSGTSGKFEKLNKDEYIRRFLIGDISCYIWTRMIKRELLLDIDFGIGISLGEDTYLNIELMDKINTIVKVDKNLINYRVRSSSLSKKYDDSIYDIWKIISVLKEKDFIRNNKKFRCELDMFIYEHVFVGRILDKVNFNSKIHKNMYEMYKAQNIQIYDNKYFKDNVSNKHKILTYAFLSSYDLGIKVNKIIRKVQKGIGRNGCLESYQ